jgi:hypothetical protein
MGWPQGKPRGPRKPRTEDGIEQMSEGVEVTYLPCEGDPVTIKWRGVEFKANVPVLVSDDAHIEAARGNKFFGVGGEAKTDNPNRAPVDAMDYRAHVIDWMRDVQTVEELVTYWAADRNLRGKCDVGDDDIRYLGTIIEPKLRDLRNQEGLNQVQVAQIWIDHGILELPWRA